MGVKAFPDVIRAVTGEGRHRRVTDPEFLWLPKPRLLNVKTVGNPQQLHRSAHTDIYSTFNPLDNIWRQIFTLLGRGES